MQAGNLLSSRIRKVPLNLGKSSIDFHLPEQIDAKRLMDRFVITRDESTSPCAAIKNAGTIRGEFYCVGGVGVDWLVDSVHEFLSVSHGKN